MTKPIILAPAGGVAAVTAAVRCGADAVYLGAKNFNARRNAENFDDLALPETVKFCHERGTKVFVTVNTLVTDGEMDALIEEADAIAETGADAVILQDPAVMRLFRDRYPALPRHASTQTAVHDLDGALYLQDLGCETIVLARELTLSEMEKIASRLTTAGAEAFVHGAHCMSVSGACYLSAMLGGRSGNRGLCAQPCRLPYNGGYPLSLKDLMLAGHVAELADWGVSSLKIEGRMKRPEYAAIVTKVYADLLREHRKPTAGERDILRRVFSRDGFTDGYYTGKKGDSMFGTKTDVPMSEVKSLYDEAARRFAEGKEAPLVPVNLFFSARRDTGAVLSAGEVTVTGGTEQAKNRPTTPEMVEKSLSKTGGTPFYVKNMHIEVEDGLVVPASVMNGMRRDALALLLSKRSVAPSRDWMDGNVLPRDEEAASREGFRGYTAAVRTEAQAKALEGLGLEAVYAPLEVAARTGLPAVLPRVFSDSEQGQIEMLLGEAMSRGTNTVLVGNIGHIPLARRLGFAVHGDFGLNAYNSRTLCALAEMGVSRQTLSFEARLAQIRDMSGPLETDLIVYGRLPLMIFENCAIRRQHGGKCSCKNGVTVLTDRRHESFPLLPEYGCRNTLIGNRPLCLREDFARLGVQTARLLFTTESPEECAHIARAFLSGAPLEGEFTRGLYKRGVE